MNRHEEWLPTMFVVMVSYHVCCNYNDYACLIVIMITSIITMILDTINCIIHVFRFLRLIIVLLLYTYMAVCQNPGT